MAFLDLPPPIMSNQIAFAGALGFPPKVKKMEHLTFPLDACMVLGPPLDKEPSKYYKTFKEQFRIAVTQIAVSARVCIENTRKPNWRTKFFSFAL